MSLWKAGTKRKPEILCSSGEALVNPGRGWYHIYTFRLGKPDYDQLKWLPFYEEESLVLVRLDIADFRERELDDKALSFGAAVFAVMKEHQKDVILRVCYDTEGKGMEREPASFSLVLTHIRQMAQLASEYEDVILTAQGLFVGSWGEMHTSHFLEEKQICCMVERWQEQTLIPLSFRKPCQMRLMGEKERIGLYDDALFSTESHMGTFGEKRKDAAEWKEPWCPEDEFSYLHSRREPVFCGGEAVSGGEYSTKETIALLKNMQVTYLNCVYDDRRLKEWKEKKLSSGESLYSYIGRHLGYRIAVKKVSRKRDVLSLTLENTGFAPMYEAADLFVEYGDSRILFPADLRRLGSGETMTVSATLHGKETKGTSPEPIHGKSEVRAGMARKKDGAAIRFANQGAGTTLLIRKGEKLARDAD